MPDLINQEERRQRMIAAFYAAPDNLQEAALQVRLKINELTEKNVLPAHNNATQWSYARSATEDTDGRRVRTSFPRIVRRQLGITTEDMRDNILRDLGQHMQGHINLAHSPVKIANGNDGTPSGQSHGAIEEVYRRTPPPSCMRGGCARFTKIYDANPQAVSILYVDDPQGLNHDILAKALIWTCDDGYKFLDRVYTTSRDGSQEAGDDIVAWARSEGYEIQSNVYRGWDRQDLGNAQVTMNMPEEYTGSLSDRSRWYLPYTDSLCKGSWVDGELVLHSCESNPSNSGDSWSLCSTGGEGLHKCPNCADGYVLYDADESIQYVRYSECGSCNYRSAPLGPKCYHCEQAGRTLTTLENGRHVCENCLEQRYSECHNCEAQHYRDLQVTIDENEHPICRTCAESEALDWCRICSRIHYAEGSESQLVTRGRRGQHTVCGSCIERIGAHECAECGQWHSVNVSEHDGDHFCHNCAGEAVPECVHCGDRFRASILTEDGLCVACAAEDRVDNLAVEESIAIAEQLSSVRDSRRLSEALQITAESARAVREEITATVKAAVGAAWQPSVAEGDEQ